MTILTDYAPHCRRKDARRQRLRVMIGAGLALVFFLLALGLADKLT